MAKPKGGTIRTVRRSGDFFTSPKQPFNDSSLSFGARGILAYIFSKPDDWVLRNDDLYKQSPAGRTAIDGMLKELKESYYLRRHKEQDEDGHLVWVTIMYEFKEDNPEYMASEKGGSDDYPKVRFPTVGKPDDRKTRRSGIPTVGKPDDILIMNKDTNNKDKDDLFVNLDLPTYSHNQLVDAWVYYREPGTHDLIRASVKDVTPQRLRLNIDEGIGVKLVDPTNRVFFLNGGPGLNRVVVAEEAAGDDSSEGLPADVLTMKNRLIDLIKPDNTFKTAGYVVNNQMKDIQDSAFSMVKKEMPISDLDDFEDWWRNISFAGQSGNPVTLKAMRKYWLSEFKPWQEEQRQAKDGQSLVTQALLESDTREALTPEAELLDSLQGVLKTIAPTAYQNLFSDLVPVGEDDNILIVSVPKPGNLEWIENRYQEVVSRAAHQVRADLSVRFVCETG